MTVKACAEKTLVVLVPKFGDSRAMTIVLIALGAIILGIGIAGLVFSNSFIFTKGATSAANMFYSSIFVCALGGAMIAMPFIFNGIDRSIQSCKSREDEKLS